MVQSVQRQLELGKTVWIVIHRPELYEIIQSLLDEQEIRYDVLLEPLNDDSFNTQESQARLLDTATVKLVLADLIRDTRPSQESTVASTTIAMFVLDRSELIEDDHRIAAFCRNMPLFIELGYYLSLDDPVVSRVMDPVSMLVLEQMGLDKHFLITSNLITSRLNRLLKREAKQRRASM